MMQQLQDVTSDESRFIRLLTGVSKENYQSEIKNTLDVLTKKGWDRNYFYNLCVYALNNLPLPEQDLDAIDNFITTLTGFCHPSVIVKFPGDPVDEDHFLEYVYSKKWLQ